MNSDPLVIKMDALVDLKQTKSADLIEQLKTSTSALINRGGGDCVANDIFNQDFMKVKTENGEALLVLFCEKNSLPFETRQLPLMPHKACTVGRFSSKCKPTTSNAYFDCKVLSRNQAVVWFDDESKFWLKDTKSSNGTYLNGSKLNEEEATQLHAGDVIQFGLAAFDNKYNEFHNCIIASVQLYLPEVKSMEAAVDIETCDTMNNCVADYADEPHDICETSRTTVESEVHDKHLKLPAISTLKDRASHICIDLNIEKIDKPIKVELHSIQSFIEAIRNSNLETWNAISKEDTFLYRIYTLQNKISFLENGLNEDELQFEKQQWEIEKHFYKHTTKNEICRVELECKDMVLKIEQVESKHKSMENDCEMLRDQIDSKDQMINDYSCLLRHIEIDYDEYKTEMQIKNEKLNLVLQEKLNDLMQKLQKIELKQVNLSKVLEKLQKLENKKLKRNDTKAQSYFLNKFKIEKPKYCLEHTILNFQKLQQHIKHVEQYHGELENHNSYSEISNFSKLNATFNELLKYCKELESLIIDKKHSKSVSENVGITQNILVKSTKDASEQTINFECYETRLLELQSKLAERELETEHLCDMLENECDMYRKKLLQLQQHNAQRESFKKPKLIENKTNIDDHINFEKLEQKLSCDINKKHSELAEAEDRLTVWKLQLNESQAETIALQATLIELETMQHQNDNFLFILTPMFLGLIGMIFYLIIKFSF